MSSIWMVSHFVSQVCHEDTFLRDHRTANGGGGSTGGQAGGSAAFLDISRGLLMLALAVLILPYINKPVY
jgi:hypothetical protein